MDIIATQVSNIEQNQINFIKKFDLHRRVFLEEGSHPSDVENAELLKLFQSAFPLNSEYLEKVFLESNALANNFDIQMPPIPLENIFDLDKEPLKGFGHGLFLRLIYIDNLVRKTMAFVQENIVVASPTVLPNLRLSTATEIFTALRLEASLQLTQSSRKEDKMERGTLRRILSFAFGEVSSTVFQTGRVVELSKLSKVSGEMITTAQVIFQNTQGNNPHAGLKEIIINEPQKDFIKVGDLIGATGVKKQKSVPKFLTADQLSILVPAEINAFLEMAEPNFNKSQIFDDLTNEDVGIIAFGRIIDIDDRTRTMTIKDKDNNSVSIRLSKTSDCFNLKKGDMFIATPTQLGNDGIYTISPETTLKLKDPNGGRLLLSFKRQIDSSKSYQNADFSRTEPL